MTDLQTLKSEHRELFDDFCRLRPGEPHLDFDVKLAGFLSDLPAAAKTARQREDYLWFCDTLEQWRSAMPGLGVKVDVAMPPPPAVESAGPAPASDTTLEELVANRADRFGRDRITTWNNARSIDEMTAAYREHFGSDVAWVREKADWALAETHLAADIIERRVDLVYDVGPDSYWRLEGRDGRMWLERVVALKAYYRWLEKGRGWGITQSVDDYVWAALELRKLVEDNSHKAAQVAFEPIGTHLLAHYVGADGRLLDNARTREWIQVKADRLVEKRHLPNRTEAEQKAKRYMEKFYEHIVFAVLAADDDSIREVQEALGFRTGFEENQEMINCFEFAVAVYFLEGPRP
ncbi:MAG TPA: hypothetical protein VHE61_05645 [Opitutaceae bacterium]|nr:hypothetical protein [Opitutaceae bacterium]